MSTAFSLPLDIANRALQHCRMARVSSIFPPDQNRNAQEVSFVYDKLRLAEMQRNMWKFSTRRVILRPVGIDSSLWTPPLWISGSNYSLGAVVGYASLNGPNPTDVGYWTLAVSETDSTTSPDMDPDWHHYTGPLAIDLYNTGAQGTGSSAAVNDSQNYQAGEIALVPATWAIGTTYSVNQVVNYNSSWYVSLVNSNTGNEPDTSPTDWVIWTSQGRSQSGYGITATGSDIPLSYPGAYSVFVSLYNNNADNPANGTSNWLNVGGTISQLRIAWPINSGPYNDAQTLNVFLLPNGYLKRAPTDPKGGQLGYLGANSGVSPEDWVFEGPYLVTGTYGPIMLRFMADITDVSAMDPMFCEGLACRIADAVAGIICPPETIGAVLRAIKVDYKTVMGDARASNAIEIGPISPVENRYVTVRA